MWAEVAAETGLARVLSAPAEFKATISAPVGAAGGVLSRAVSTEDASEMRSPSVDVKLASERIRSAHRSIVARTGAAEPR